MMTLRCRCLCWLAATLVGTAVTGIAFSHVAQAQQSGKADKPVFVTVDKNNVPVFSDTPSPGATQITLQEANRMAAVTPALLPKLQAEAVVSYQVRVVQPAEQDTVRDNNGTVYVQGQVRPVFAQGLRVQLWLDGQLAGGPASNANFVLHNVERGERNIRIELLDQNGAVIATSDTTTFFMHRASLIKPK